MRTPSTSAVPGFEAGFFLCAALASAVSIVLLLAGVSGRADAGGAFARSRPTLRASLSSRRPWYDAWRMLPSGVHSVNTISATRVGRTQWSSAAGRVIQRVERVVAAG